MKFIKVVIFFLNLRLFLCEPSDESLSYSTSVIAMTKLLKTERWLLDTFHDDVFNGTDNRNLLKIALKNLNKEHAKSDIDPEKYLSNPLNSFAYLRRLRQDWPIILNNLGQGVIRKIMEVNVDFPSSEDLSEAALSMERIRKTYKLRPGDIAEGRFNDVQYDGRLSKLDLFEIGYELYKLNEHTEAVYWLNESLYTNYHGLLPEEILNFDQGFIESIYHDAVQERERLMEEKERADTEIGEIYESSCHGRRMKVSSKLFCRYNTTVSPFQILAPSKMEELSIDPFIIIYHDVLTHGEIEEIKDKARSNMARSGVYGTDGKKFASTHRTAHDARIVFRNSTVAKITGITGLNSKGFEKPAVINYGLGGHYDLHVDYLYPMKDHMMDEYGDRIATILIYLKDVQQGGATVFPWADVYVAPEKGALLLWYNFKNNGSPDTNTAHRACPVVYGSKWGATIWVRKFDQFRSLPCYDP